MAPVSLPDISNKNFIFQTVPTKNGKIKQAVGRLGVPNQVQTHCLQKAQRGVSKGTGDDADHLIVDRFGAPGDERNLGLQNWRANRYGTFKELENEWAAKLKSGTEIEVNVRDFYRKGEEPPFRRFVEWTEILPGGVATNYSEITD